MMRLIWVMAAVLLISPPVWAAEPAPKPPCENFAWPMSREQAAFAASPAEARSGAKLDTLPVTSVKIALSPLAEAGLPLTPEKSPKDAAAAKAAWLVVPVTWPGVYQVTVDGKLWVDAVQGGASAKSLAHGGDPSCTLFHKSVRFELKGEPLTLQFSGEGADSVTFTILPAE